LLGRAGDAKHQSRCPLNLAKAVVQHPACGMQAYLLAGTREKWGRCWQQGYAQPQDEYSGQL